MENNKSKINSHIIHILIAWLILMLIFIGYRLFESEYRVLIYISNPFSISLILVIIMSIENRRFSTFMRNEHKDVWEVNCVGVLKNRLSWLWDVDDDHPQKDVVCSIKKLYHTTIAILYILFVLTFISWLVIINLIR